MVASERGVLIKEKICWLLTGGKSESYFFPPFILIVILSTQHNTHIRQKYKTVHKIKIVWNNPYCTNNVFFCSIPQSKKEKNMPRIRCVSWWKRIHPKTYQLWNDAFGKTYLGFNAFNAKVKNCYIFIHVTEILILGFHRKRRKKWVQF